MDFCLPVTLSHKQQRLCASALVCIVSTSLYCAILVLTRFFCVFVLVGLMFHKRFPYACIVAYDLHIPIPIFPYELPVENQKKNYENKCAPLKPISNSLDFSLYVCMYLFYQLLY